MKIFAYQDVSKIKFSPRTEEARFPCLEVEIPSEKMNYWLKYNLDEYVEEYEALPRVDKDPLSEEWDEEYEANVRLAAKKLEEKGLLSQVVCNYLNDEGDEDSFYLETKRKFSIDF